MKNDEEKYWESGRSSSPITEMRYSLLTVCYVKAELTTEYECPRYMGSMIDKEDLKLLKNAIDSIQLYIDKLKNKIEENTNDQS